MISEDFYQKRTRSCTAPPSSNSNQLVRDGFVRKLERLLQKLSSGDLDEELDCILHELI